MSQPLDLLNQIECVRLVGVPRYSIGYRRLLGVRPEISRRSYQSDADEIALVWVRADVKGDKQVVVLIQVVIDRA
jgi:hypothetical protein